MTQIQRAITLALLAMLVIVTLEVVGRAARPDALDLIADIDHRMKPGSLPDINVDGIRSRRPAEEFHRSGTNILFLGDSFVFGWDLPTADTVPAVLESISRRELSRPDIRVANFGWVSSSPLLSLRLLRDIGAKYRPDVVLLGLDMTDFQDDIKYRRLLDRRGLFRLIDVAPYTFLATRKAVSMVSDRLHERVFGYPARRFFVTDGPLEDTRRHFAQIQTSIDAIAHHTTTVLGAKFVLFVLARPYQYSAKESPRNWEASEYSLLGPYAEEPFRYFRELQGSVSYPVFDLLEDFKQTDVFPTAFESDPHWNADGARVAAEAVYRYCREAGCFQ